MTIIATGWSPAGWEEYGQRFADSFARHWPEGYDLLAYVEEPCDLSRGHARLIDKVSGVQAFLDRHEDDLEARGAKVTARWPARDRAKAYSFRFDARKFGRVAFYHLDAAEVAMRRGREVLVWLDGDVVTFRDIEPGWIENLIPPDKDVAFLGRGSKHSEIGFVGYRLPGAKGLIDRFAWYYEGGHFKSLPEWHSAFVWDRARADCPKLRQHDMTPGGRGHVWFQSPLGQYLDHLKGDRKSLGRSPERPSAS